MNVDVFAKRLLELRTSKNLSTRQLAKKLNIAYPSISHWENCNRMPSAENISKLARFFGVSSDYLMGNED